MERHPPELSPAHHGTTAELSYAIFLVVIMNTHKGNREKIANHSLLSARNAPDLLPGLARRQEIVNRFLPSLKQAVGRIEAGEFKNPLHFTS